MADKLITKKLMLIPLLVGLFFALLYLFAPWRALELGVYDAFLHLKPAVPQDPSIVLLDVDDASIESAGIWPWPRSFMARGMEVLTEFGARSAVFDIEYSGKSPDSVDKQYLSDGLRNRFQNDFGTILDNVAELVNAVGNQRVDAADLPEFHRQLDDSISEIGQGLYESAGQVAVENDSRLGNAMRMFGASYVAFFMEAAGAGQGAAPAEANAFGVEHFSYANAAVPGNFDRSMAGFTFPTPAIAEKTKGGGFVNTVVDPDGKRRRMQLVNFIGGKAYLQLVFAPLLDQGGRPALSLRGTTLHLAGLRLGGGAPIDLDIPVDEQGRMLINWPKELFVDSFKPHISFLTLLDYRQTEDALASTLERLESNQAFQLLGDHPVRPALEAWRAADAARLQAERSGAAADREAFVAAKREFYRTFDAAAASGFLERARRAVDAQAKRLGASGRSELAKVAERLEADGAALAAYHKKLGALRAQLAARLAGAFCIVGQTSHATTDLGVTPFDEKYPNVGSHASVLNTILQRRFLQEAPQWWSSLLALALACGLVWLARRLRLGAIAKIWVGLAAAAAWALVDFGLFAATGCYLALLSPLLAVLLSFVAYSLAEFFLSEQEKAFLRKAFATYLPEDVIKEYVADPTLLKLGGSKKRLSALFTDIKGFSTMSEKMEPEDLVNLLNQYLTGMSDIIMAEGGTIDKYEGDAIIGFFGAPKELENNARAVCLAAIAMRAKEAEMNEAFVRDGLIAQPLRTRFGVNTGDMVVGNMGTDTKMNYTIMGNEVNLAARLEGVNKVYGTWVLATDATRQAAGEGFAWRRLDRVRVVGIKQPVVLHELVGQSAGLEPDRWELLEAFEQALEAYDAQDWRRALSLFGALAKRFPEDPPTALFAERCRGFAKTPPADWDGVHNLTEK